MLKALLRAGKKAGRKARNPTHEAGDIRFRHDTNGRTGHAGCRAGCTPLAMRQGDHPAGSSAGKQPVPSPPGRVAEAG